MDFEDDVYFKLDGCALLISIRIFFVFQERFDPIVDSTSGRDFIPTMLFG